MELLGNTFTHYNYSHTDISQIQGDNVRKISSVKSNFEVIVELDKPENTELPPNSPFANWKEARRFAGPLPFTFTHKKDKEQILIIEGVRQNWTPKPVRVLWQQFSFIEALGLKGGHLANAFEVTQVPYYWKKGIVEGVELRIED